MQISQRFPRISRLFALTNHRRLRRLLGVLAWLAVGLYFAFGLLMLVLRHFVMPAVGDYRSDIERNLSQALGQPVAIRAIEGGWRALWPSLHIQGLEIRDAQGRPALGFDEVEADIAWSSLWYLAPHFARLELKSPRLDLRRDKEGRLFVAGLEIKADESSGSGFSDWLLSQDRIVIRDATVTWHDEQRAAPPLSLAHLNFDLRNRWSRHRFGLTAEPPRELAARLDVRGDFRGSGADFIESGKGQLYAEMDYADLSGWRQWVDYPIELPHGDGGLRLWLSFDRKALTAATADVRLGRTIVRLARDLPMLDLERMDGRLEFRHDEHGFKVGSRHLSLATRNGIRLAPTDFDLRWQVAEGTRPASGEASANVIDLGVMGALAAYLPFEKNVRDEVVAWGAQGQARDMQVAWTGDADALRSYRIKARFENLGLNARGALPGFFGLDGTVEGNERGGTLRLATRSATFELPNIFAGGELVLASLDATADWLINGGKVEVRLQRARFDNADATGEASGRWQGDGKGPGTIDLSAKLTRAAGGAVWQYMPLVVNQAVRDWLQNSIIGGSAAATLRLKGDLDRFPFKDGSGIFEVKGPFKGATLRYAEGWPAFDDVEGELLFEGAHMLISAKRANLWGVRLADVKADIADLDDSAQPMVITGTARGPTPDFLRFIDESPVSGYINNVTENMKGKGAGELRLRLDLPLQDVNSTKVDGRIRLTDNELLVDEALPSITNINGELHFTEAGLDAKKIRGRLLDAPATVDIATTDGEVGLQMAGGASVAALRQRYTTPLFEHMAGSTTWSGSIRIKNHDFRMRFESSLLGISSSLPDPFNKTAGDARPLVFERASLPTPAEAGEETKVSLGDTLQARILRRREAERLVLDRGVISIGAPDIGLPTRGLLLAVTAPRVDIDLWLGLATAAGDDGGGGLIDAVAIKTPELRALGRSVHDLELAGWRDIGTWKFDIRSREAVGQVEWTDGEDDKLIARLAKLDIPESTTPAAGRTTTGGASGDATQKLPDVDATIDQLMWHGRDLGRLELKATNAETIWGARFRISNSDGEVSGTSSWQEPSPGVIGASALDFSLNANSIEGMLGRLGFPEAIRRGRANLTGQVYWDGAPTRIDYPSLGGNLLLEASRGQFRKLEPGVGRLLGVLSLQSLPRRASLDFRDIFSEGFAFESINGTVHVLQGVMRTEEFEIDGPAAKVLMNGSVNLINETEDLKVRVQPTIGETVATGAILVNPVIGATAWLMNRIFGNPLDKAFAFDYAVTGSWADPKVEKVAVQGPGSVLVNPEGVTP